jgi:hypothetical protein
MRTIDVHAMIERDRFPLPVSHPRAASRARLFFWGLAFGLALGINLSWLFAAGIIHT